VLALSEVTVAVINVNRFSGYGGAPESVFKFTPAKTELDIVITFVGLGKKAKNILSLSHIW